MILQIKLGNTYLLTYNSSLEEQDKVEEDISLFLDPTALPAMFECPNKLSWVHIVHPTIQLYVNQGY